ncbi:MAG TPA: DUF559 domain-containing protein [Lapillicoccus sp.]|nr:DUF559 domain-containing protein [Lapillicoccus sp.]
MTSSAFIHRRMAALAEEYDGVLSRDLLRGQGVSRHGIDRQETAERWRVVGNHTVSMHTGKLSLRAQAWRAIWEVPRKGVAIDGVTALQLAGLVGFDAGEVTVSVPWEARLRRVPGVKIHRVCRIDDELVAAGIPRVRSPTATIRAANWASSDRQAALLLALPVQQRLITASHLREVLRDEHVRGRRELVRQLVADIADGAHSLGELDFARLCRRRGLPEPDRQVVVATRGGRIYLDVCWKAIGLVVEIDGSGHRQGLKVLDDNLRQNRVTIDGNMVLRFDLLSLRLVPDEVLDQVVEAYVLLTGRRAS